MCGARPSFELSPEAIEALSRRHAVQVAAVSRVAQSPEELVEAAEAIRTYIHQGAPKSSGGDTEA